jgi:hypothetical protein
MKSILLLLLMGAFVFSAEAADTTAVNLHPWRLQFETGIGLTQSSYSDNWQGGEAGSLIWVAGFLGKAEKQLAPSWFWSNQLKLEFGQTHSQDKETKHWREPQKSADKIRYDGIVRLTKGWVVDPYGAATFESQFLDAASPLHKRYVNPIDLTEAAGVARDIFKVENVRQLTTRLGVGLRQHLATMDDPIDPNLTKSETTNDGGIEWVTDYLLGSAKSKTSFVSKLTVFQALFNSKSKDLTGPTKDYWKTADVNWDNTFRANLTSVLQMNLAWQWLYDKEIAKGGRFKETLTLGVAYKFANFKDEKK